MSRAIEVAKSAGIDVPIGCIITFGNKVIAEAHNEVELRQDPTAHAELLCIQRACQKLSRRNLEECTLICTLEPCPMCAEAIALARISSVIFGAFANQASSFAVKCVGGVCESICSALISDYFINIRKSR